MKEMKDGKIFSVNDILFVYQKERAELLKSHAEVVKSLVEYGKCVAEKMFEIIEERDALRKELNQG